MEFKIIEKDNYGRVLSQYESTESLSNFDGRRTPSNSSIYNTTLSSSPKYLRRYRFRLFQNVHINFYLPNILPGTSAIQEERNFVSGDVESLDKKDNPRVVQQLVAAPSISQSLIAIFLPSGYPRTVRNDYKYYQIYDTLQAFCSSISNLFANRSVLDIVGVGDEDANSTVALYYTIMQQICGRLTTILFAWEFGEWIEPECKKWRYMGDLYNNGAILLDVFVSLFLRGLIDKGYSTNIKIIGLLCSGILRALCGVVAAGSRAALTVHFTLNEEGGSISDVSAKDSSQETVITLCGMLVGTWMVSVVPADSPVLLISSIMIALAAIHLYTNFQAVSSVVMTGLNRQRASIVFGRFIITRQILSPSQVAELETIIPDRDDELFLDVKGSILGYAKFVTFSDFLNFISKENNQVAIADFDIKDILIECPFGYYALWPYDIDTNERTSFYTSILTKSGAENSHTKWLELTAWLHCLLLSKYIKEQSNEGGLYNEKRSGVIKSSVVDFKSMSFDRIKNLINSTNDDMKELTELLYDPEKSRFSNLWNISATMVNPKNLVGETQMGNK